VSTKSILIISAIVFLSGCQTSFGEKQKAFRSPAETVTLGNTGGAVTDKENEVVILQDLQMEADISIPKGSPLQVNMKKDQRHCSLQLRGPKRLFLGMPPNDEDKIYRLDYRVPGYVNNSGYSSMTGHINLGLSLPLDKESPYKAGSIMDYASFLKGDNYFYKDGKFMQFEIADKDHRYLVESGGKNRPIFITRHTIEVDPLLKSIKSITTEIRLGDVYSDVSNFDELPLQAKTTCTNNNNISLFDGIL
jgi:hypothetical protein